MPRKILATAILWSATANVLAADDARYEGAYEFQAADVIGDMARTCTTLFPEVAPRAKKAYASWLARNSSEADAAAKSCDSRIRQLASAARTRKKADLRVKINAEYRAMMVDSLKTQAKQGLIVCNGILFQMETPGGPLDN